MSPIADYTVSANLILDYLPADSLISQLCCDANASGVSHDESLEALD